MLAFFLRRACGCGEMSGGVIHHGGHRVTRGKATQANTNHLETAASAVPPERSEAEFNNGLEISS
jgi:hypothetical protein